MIWPANGDSRSWASGVRSDITAPLSRGIAVVRSLARAGLIAPLRPDRYLRMAAAMRRVGMTGTAGFAASAQRCPDASALVDDLGVLTWRELDQRCDALAAALQDMPILASGDDAEAGQGPKSIAIMCRNHRGFVEALVAAERIGADALLLNTSFAGPALADVIARECIQAIIFDEEFSDLVEEALVDAPQAGRIIGWTDESTKHAVTLEKLIGGHRGRRPLPRKRTGTTILLTSGTTGTPKGARRAASGGAAELAGILEGTPWRAGQTTVIAAPMFHAWGYSQLLFSALMACTIVTRRKFDPEAMLDLVDRHHASGLCVVPVMVERIVDLPDEVRNKYSCRSLRFVSASGSRMRPDAVIAFMDQFGDVIYNNYNATEAGMIALATPADLRAAPDTAGRPAPGTELRILNAQHRAAPTGEVGQIFVRSSTLFDGYTSGNTKDFHDGFMASGDLGYIDDAGRLFVVGRDDEMIVSGGENVYPIEVENCLLAHPAVAEAAVIGVDDVQYGQRLVAFVVLRGQASASVEDLKAFVRDHLANFKVPREIRILEELPRGGTGKVQRTQLHAEIRTSD